MDKNEGFGQAPGKWRILDYGCPPVEWDEPFSFECPECGWEALLPVKGRVNAELANGALIFSRGGPAAVPFLIQCRGCYMRYEHGGLARDNEGNYYKRTATPQPETGSLEGETNLVR
jgi:hypothetical protein